MNIDVVEAAAGRLPIEPVTSSTRSHSDMDTMRPDVQPRGRGEADKASRLLRNEERRLAGAMLGHRNSSAALAEAEAAIAEDVREARGLALDSPPDHVRSASEPNHLVAVRRIKAKGSDATRQRETPFTTTYRRGAAGGEHADQEGCDGYNTADQSQARRMPSTSS